MNDKAIEATTLAYWSHLGRDYPPTDDDRGATNSIIAAYLSEMEKAGFVMVPKEAHRNMILAGDLAIIDATGDAGQMGLIDAVYDAMIEARPKEPTK